MNTDLPKQSPKENTTFPISKILNTSPSGKDTSGQGKRKKYCIIVTKKEPTSRTFLVSEKSALVVFSNNFFP